MPSIKIVAKEGHEVLSQTTDKNSVALTEASVVTLGVAKADISEIQRNGADVVIRLKSGEVIVIQNFYSTTTATDNSLVLEDGNQLLWVKLTDETGAFLAEVVYEPLTTIEPLLYSEGVPLWAWAAGAVAVGGLAAGLSGGGSDGGNGGGDQGPSAAYKAATAAVVAAEQAYQDAKDALTAANTDGLINPTEKAALEKAKTDAEAAKAAAQAKVEALPATEQTAKDALDERLEALTDPVITVPAVNDADGNGVIDSADVAAATAAVVAAEEAEQDLIDAIADKGGVINPQDKAELDAIKTELDGLKGTAQGLVNNLPASTDKTDLQGKLDALNTQVPAINDADSNGKPDDVDAAIAAAKAAVAAAEAKHTALKDAIADKGGVINPQDKAELDAIKTELDGLKGTAQGLVNNLPASTDKTDLQGKLDALNTQVPAINDADSNGKPDDVDAAIAAAKAAVAAAEAKHTALKDAIADKGGVINPQDKAELDAIKTELDGLKGTAQGLVNNLPASTDKTDLQGKLDALNTQVPAINDADSNGKPDDVDAAIAAAKAAVAAAEAKHTALKDAIADKGGVINPQDKAELDAIKTELDGLKGTAQGLVNNLPASTDKTDLQGKLDALNTQVPAINDADSNGKPDDVDAAIAAAKAAVAAAEAKHTALKDAIADKGGVINPQDKAELDAIKTELDGLKGTAQGLVNNLPASTDKTDLQGKLDALNTQVPAINDADSNGKPDDVDAAIAAAKAAVAAAEAKHTALKDAIADKGGVINPQDKAELDAIKTELDGLKGTAQGLVNNLPASTDKTDLQGKLDALNTQVPAINDADSNGKPDDVDAAIAAAKAAVAAAEAKHTALKDAIADKGGVINPQDKAELDAIKTELDGLKGTAQGLVNNLPASTDKTDLQGKLDALNTQVPAINDADSNGKPDDVDAAIAAAKAAVAAAEAKHTALKDAIADKGGVINPQDKAELDAIKTELDGLKGTAQGLVNNLPASTDKTDLQGKLDALNTQVPAINDADSNGKPDDVDAAIAAAKAAVAAAEAKHTALKDAIADKGGVINPQDKAELDAIKTELDGLKGTAQGLVNNLPASTDKTDLQGKLDALNTQVPAINDADSNGKPDDVDAAIAAAKAAVAAAEAKHTALKDAIADKGGVINPQDKAELDAIKTELDGLKGTAQGLVNNLPASTDKTDLQGKLDALNTQVPAINDADSNGKPDDVDAAIAAAKAAVAAAEAKHTALKDAIADKGGVINPQDKAELDAIKTELDGLKGTAQGLVNNLPASTDKTDLQGKLDALNTQVPAINDADSNGKPDDVDAAIAAAKAAVAAAEAKHTALKDAIADKGGVINPQDKAELDAIKTELDGLKGTAQGLVNNLPASTDKTDLQGKLDALNTQVPAINDADSNGKPDDVDAAIAAAKAAVAAAEAKHTALKDAIADKGGVINPQDKAELDAIKTELDGLKGTAQGLVNNLPASTDKTDLQGKLDALNTQVPAINDADSNGKPDDVDAAIAAAKAAVAAAEAKHTALKDAIADKGGVINPQDKAELDAIKTELDGLKGTAQGLVNNLPASTDKTDLQGKLDALNTEVPAVNDADSNGKPDDVDAAIAAAKAAVAAAEAKHTALKDAIADKGGVINPQDKAELDAIKTELDGLKGTAQGLVNNLPASTDKTDLQGKLDALNTQVPAINDADSNGKPDDVDAAIAAAKAAVAAAEAKHTALKDAIADKGGVINPQDKAELDAIKTELDGLKGTAQGLVNNLPASTDKTDLQGKLDALNTQVPAINDADSNGKPDDVDAAIAAAKAAVAAAEAKHTALKDAIADKGGVINPQDKAELDAIKTELDGLKGTAQGLVNNLPASTDKTDLQGKLDALNTQVPAINDADSNGKPDDVDAAIAAAKAAVAAAEAKHTALKDAIADKGGVINPQDKAELDAIKTELDGLKGTAQGLVNNLPASTDKTDLQGKLDALNTEVPAVNDADSNKEIDPVIFATINEDESFTVTKAELLAKALNPNASITDLNADYGTFVDNGDNTWTFTPKENYAGDVKFSYKVDGANASGKVTLTAVADAPGLEVTPPTVVTPTAGNGLTVTKFKFTVNSKDGVTSDILLNKFTEATPDSVQPTKPVTSVSEAGLAKEVGTKLSGLIYLEAGKTYTFGGIVDDSAAIVIGGRTVASGNWGKNDGEITGTFKPTASGYYEIDIYAHNDARSGSYNITIQSGTEAAHTLGTADKLFTDTAAVESAGVNLGGLNSSGYYTVYGANEGAAGTAIKISNVAANLMDTDGSESLTLVLSGLPTGAVLSDGNNTFTATAGQGRVDISTWDTSKLTYTPPANASSGKVSLTVTATSTEITNKDTATSSGNIDITVHAISDVLLGNFENASSVLGNASAWNVTGGTLKIVNNRLEINDASDGNATKNAVANSKAFQVQHAGSSLSFNLWSEGYKTTLGDSGKDWISYALQKQNSDGSWTTVPGTSFQTNEIDLNAMAVKISVAEAGTYRLSFTVADSAGTQSGNDLKLMVDDIVLKAPAESLDAPSNPTVTAGKTNAVFMGGTADDVLNGGVGHDVLNGGAGHDILTGGTGNDTAVYNVLQAADATAGNGQDTWTDFAIGKVGGTLEADKIEFGKDFFDGLFANKSNISEFIKVENDGVGNAVLKVARNGATGGSEYHDLLVLEGRNGLTLQQLLDNNQIIIG